MGLFFNLFVETGNDEEANKKIREYFISIGKIKTSYGLYSMIIGDVENDIGITVSVHETGHTGLGSPEEIAVATQVGFGFYELLKTAPNFRYAMVGVEAGEWADGQNILDQNFDGYLPKHGLVVNNELGLITDEPLLPFRDGYSWTPYEGEMPE